MRRFCWRISINRKVGIDWQEMYQKLSLNPPRLVEYLTFIVCRQHNKLKWWGSLGSASSSIRPHQTSRFSFTEKHGKSNRRSGIGMAHRHLATLHQNWSAAMIIERGTVRPKEIHFLRQHGSSTLIEYSLVGSGSMINESGTVRPKSPSVTESIRSSLVLRIHAQRVAEL